MRELAGFAGDLVVAPARPHRETRDSDRFQDLRLAEHSLEDAAHEVLDSNRSLPGRACDKGHGADRGKGAYPIGCRVGVGEAAAEGAAVANGAVGDITRD